MSFEIAFPVGIVHRRLGRQVVIAEGLFHPELARLGPTRERAAENLRRNLERVIEGLPPDELAARRRAVSAGTRVVTVPLSPPASPTPAWREPVLLHFTAVTWTQGDMTLARVPDLDIVVIAPKPEELDDRLRREVLASLRRTKSSVGLRPLAWVRRTEKLDLDWATLTVRLPTLKQRAQKDRELDESRKPSVLKEVATDLAKAELPPAYETEETVARIADALTARRPQSVLLVGPSGVGKTAAVRELVRNRSLHQLGSTPFYQTSGSRLVAGQSGFGMWQERCRDLWKESSKKRAVLHLGGLVELMEVGKSEHNRTGIAGFLRPYIARGDLLCIAECTPEQIPLIEREDPQLLEAFHRIDVAEPDRERGRIILDRAARNAPYEIRRPWAPTALDALDRLHRRYATYSAYPGRPLRFLDNLLRDGRPEDLVTEAEVLTAFTRETGLPRVLLDPAVPLDLAAARRWFAERVIGQPEAVGLVTDLLATVKAALTRPNRPIASLLFIGPTGVGKTEMAKAIAEFLFGSRDRLTRFDMSEYADPAAVQRLAGGAFGGEGLLTAKVREQPFSVILLDEFEKAHPSLFDLLLQALGEARMTDAGGRLADFRNAVIILTSNLGAESYQQGRMGLEAVRGLAAGAKEHFVREVEKFLRPEMFNRLDRLVPFAPLDRDTIALIARREWDKVLARDGVRFRGVEVRASEEVLPHLAERGFDPRYGARPLKRAIEREVLAPFARQMNRYTGDTTLSVELRIAGGAPEVNVRPRLDAWGRVVCASRSSSELGEVATKCGDLRRLHQHLERSSVVREMRNDAYALSLVEKKLLRRQLRKKNLGAAEQEQLARLARLRDLLAAVDRQRADVFALEESVLLAFHDPQAAAADALAREAREHLDLLLVEWDALLLRLHELDREGANMIALALFSEDRGALFELARAYDVVARAGGLKVVLVRYLIPARDAAPSPIALMGIKPAKEGTEHHWVSELLVPFQDGKPKRPLLERKTLRVDEIEAYLADPPDDPLGVGLHLAGNGADLRFGSEAGLHVLRRRAADGTSYETGKVLALVGGPTVLHLIPPEGITRRDFIGPQERRRTYDAEKMLVEDVRLDERLPWAGEPLAKVLGEALHRRMRAELERMVME